MHFSAANTNTSQFLTLLLILFSLTSLNLYWFLKCLYSIYYWLHLYVRKVYSEWWHLLLLSGFLFILCRINQPTAKDGSKELFPFVTWKDYKLEQEASPAPQVKFSLLLFFPADSYTVTLTYCIPLLIFFPTPKNEQNIKRQNQRNNVTNIGITIHTVLFFKGKKLQLRRTASFPAVTRLQFTSTLEDLAAYQPALRIQSFPLLVI